MGAEWNKERVLERLEEAVDVMKRLPPVRVSGYFSLWPKIAPEFSDLVDREQPRMKRPPPPPDAITRAEETLLWLRWLELDDSRLVWMRLNRAAWKAVCWRFGTSRATAHRRWEYALSIIIWRLNGKRPPGKRSKDFVIDRAKRMSSGNGNEDIFP